MHMLYPYYNELPDHCLCALRNPRRVSQAYWHQHVPHVSHVAALLASEYALLQSHPMSWPARQLPTVLPALHRPAAALSTCSSTWAVSGKESSPNHERSA